MTGYKRNNVVYTLLIADDEMLERDAIEHIIHKSNLPFTLYKAKNGREAVECVQTHPINIALLDIKMPGINGIEAAKRIKEISPSCIIIFLSALNTFDFAQEAIRSGARDYLVKPVSSKELLTLLEMMIKEIDEEPSKSRPMQLKNILTLFNRSFFAAIKYGNISYEAMKSYFSLENIIHEQGVSIIFPSSEEENLLKYLRHLITAHDYQACYFSSKDRISVIMFAHNPKNMMENIVDDISGMYNTTWRIGISQIFFSLSEIPTSITQASQAYSYSLHQGQSLVIFSPQIEKITASVFEKRKELENSLYKNILEGNIEQSRQLMHEIQEALCSTLQGEELLNNIYETIVVLTRSISNKIPHLTFPPLQKSSLLEAERYVMDYIDYVCATIESNKDDKYKTMFQQVCSFINDHYHQELTLEVLSQKFNLSSSYFSRLFSEYCNISFSSYLTHVRIEAAKQHLSIGTKVHQVSHLVGYTDYSYFSRVFRQIVGISPKAYQLNMKAPKN